MSRATTSLPSLPLCGPRVLRGVESCTSTGEWPFVLDFSAELIFPVLEYLDEASAKIQTFQYPLIKEYTLNYSRIPDVP